MISLHVLVPGRCFPFTYHLRDVVEDCPRGGGGGGGGGDERPCNFK